MLFQRPDRLHQCPFKIITDAHDFPGRFHLRGQSMLCTDKFIKRKSWNLDHTIIQHRLKTCICFLCNGISDLVQRITERNPRRHLCDGITGCLGSQRRRPADPGIDFNHAVFKRIRIQGILHITAARNIQFMDNTESRGPKHLVFLISQRLRRSYNDAVSCMDADRIDIFHIAYGDAASIAVAHHFIFNFLPSGDAALHQHLMRAGKPESVFQNPDQRFSVMRNASAASAKRIGGTKHHRITDAFCKFHALFDAFHHQRCRTGFSYLLHGRLEGQTVFCLFDRFRRCSNQLYLMFTQKSVFLQLHCQIQGSLTAQSGKNTVRMFLQNQLFHCFGRQRFDVYMIRNVLIGHNRSRV